MSKTEEGEYHAIAAKKMSDEYHEDLLFGIEIGKFMFLPILVENFEGCSLLKNLSRECVLVTGHFLPPFEQLLDNIFNR